MRNRPFQRKLTGAAVILLLLLAAVIAGSALLERRQQSTREEELAAEAGSTGPDDWTADNILLLDGELYEFDHRIETFLFIGTDGGGSSDPEDYRGPMADFLMLVVLDHTDNTYGCLQIDRNTVTEVRELDRDGEEITVRDLQICTASWYGRNPVMAAENTVYSVCGYLGSLERIDGYLVLDAKDIGYLNRAVGGVEVTVEDDLSADDPALKRGSKVVLDDRQAERFLTARLEVGEGTNAERMARHRQYLEALFTRVKEKTLEDPEFGLGLWKALKDVSVTDMNGSAFSRIAQKLLKGEGRGIRTIGGTTVLGYILEDGEEHEEFYPDEASLRDEMIRLFSLKMIEEEELPDSGEDMDPEYDIFEDEDEDTNGP